jgi:AraC family transcriptional regulator
VSVEIKQVAGMRLACVRHMGSFHGIAQAFGRLHEVAASGGLYGPGTRMLALYHDHPATTPEAELRSDAAITVPEGTELPDGVSEGRIAAGRYASATHVGPYAGLGDAWQRLMGEWLPASGERVREGPVFEIYLNNPQDTPPEELRTELYLPLA